MITKTEIKNIANLSKLYFDDSELDAFANDLTQIVQFANEINNADVPTTDFDNINGINNALRDDMIMPSYSRNDILKNVDGGKNDLFYIKKFK